MAPLAGEGGGGRQDAPLQRLGEALRDDRRNPGHVPQKDEDAGGTDEIK